MVLVDYKLGGVRYKAFEAACKAVSNSFAVLDHRTGLEYAHVAHELADTPEEHLKLCNLVENMGGANPQSSPSDMSFHHGMDEGGETKDPTTGTTVSGARGTVAGPPSGVYSTALGIDRAISNTDNRGVVSSTNGRGVTLAETFECLTAATRLVTALRAYLVEHPVPTPPPTPPVSRRTSFSPLAVARRLSSSIGSRARKSFSFGSGSSSSGGIGGTLNRGSGGGGAIRGGSGKVGGMSKLPGSNRALPASIPMPLLEEDSMDETEEGGGGRGGITRQTSMNWNSTPSAKSSGTPSPKPGTNNNAAQKTNNTAVLTTVGEGGASAAGDSLATERELTTAGVPQRKANCALQ